MWVAAYMCTTQNWCTVNKNIKDYSAEMLCPVLSSHSNKESNQLEAVQMREARISH